MRTLRHSGKLKLTNSGQLELFWIGAGSAFSKNNFQNNLLIIKGNTHIMVDFGTLAQRALTESAGLEISDIDTFLITHSHADHIGGLECAGLMSRYFGVPVLGKSKPKMIITQRLQSIIWNQSLQGGMRWNEKGPTNKGLAFEDFFEPIRPTTLFENPREIWRLKYGDITLEIFRTMHIPSDAVDWQESFPSYGIFVDGKVFISGDMRFDPDIINHYASRALVMFQDAQFFRGGVHASIEELKSLPVGVKSKMHLMHYGDNRAEQDISDFADWVRPGVHYVFD